MKLLKRTIGLIFVFATCLLCGCGGSDDVANSLNIPSGTSILNFQNPSEDLIKGALLSVPDILQVAQVSEANDPNDLLGKADGYTSAVYFEYAGVMQDSLTEEELIDKGTDAGGCIESFKTVEDAKSRLEYLNKFGSLSGINTLVGTSIIRLSSSIEDTMVQDLFNNIVASISSFDMNTIIGVVPVVDDNVDGESEALLLEEVEAVDYEDNEVETPDENPDEVQTIIMYATDKVKVRQEPNTDCDVLALLNVGDEVEVLESRSDGWSSVSYAGVNGYIKSEFLGEGAPTNSFAQEDNNVQSNNYEDSTIAEATAVVSATTTEPVTQDEYLDVPQIAQTKSVPVDTSLATGGYTLNTNTKVLHVSGCSHGPEKAKNTAYYNTVEEAIAAGAKKSCSYCHPY